jgi:hypothetical protein
MVTARLSLPSRVWGPRADGGPSPMAAVVDRLRRVFTSGVLQRWWPDVGSVLAGWIWSAAQGIRRSRVVDFSPSLSQVAQRLLGVGDILTVSDGGSAPGGCFRVIYPQIWGLPR